MKKYKILSVVLVLLALLITAQAALGDVNTAPTTASNTVTTVEDTTTLFVVDDVEGFPYSDAEGDPLDHVTITSLPSKGTLKYDGNAISLNQEVSTADFDLRKLSFTPAENENGDSYTSFKFTVNDGQLDSAESTMTIDVTAVNDAPTLPTISAKETREGADFSLSVTVNDIDSNQADLSLVKVSGPAWLTVDSTDKLKLVGTPTAVGTVSVTVKANDGAADSAPVTFNINILEKIPAALTVSEIFFSNVKQSEETTVQFKVKNTGSSDEITGLVFNLNLDSKYNAGFVGTLPTSLAPGVEKTITLKLTPPSNENFGKHSIGNLSITADNNLSANQDIQLELISCLEIINIDINGKSSGDLSIEEDNEIEVEVKNVCELDMEDIEVVVTIEDVDGDDLEEESDSFDLKDGKSKTVTLTFDLSKEEIDEESYTILVEISGEDEDNTRYEVQETKTVDVDLENHKVVIRKAELSSATLQCSALTTLEVDIENIGKEDEDDVEIRVFNKELNIDMKRTDIELDNVLDSDNDYKTSFELLLEDAKAGTYNIQVTVLRDNDLEETKTVQLRIAECGATTPTGAVTSDKDLEAQLQAQLQEQLNQGNQVKTVTDNSFRESSNYVYLLGALTVLIFIALILALSVLVVKKH